ncbi:RNA polymerase sigma factor RpoD/SigA [candidate division KSB1 bacterium]|nr:RNA polymerase sigma factor RpoD/SigA [candidate division KSB1 bacterium]
MTKKSVSQNNKWLAKYLKDISDIAILTAEEEIELARKIRKGDQTAFERLVRANLKFVVKVAMQFKNRGLPLEDLINEGNLGLMKAAKRFDETRGYKFISFAVWWIRQSIQQAINEQLRIVRLPVNRISNISKISQAYSRLAQENERSPNLDELAAEVDMSADKVSETIQISKFTVSLETPNPIDDDLNLMDTLQDEENDVPDQHVVEESLKDRIDEVISSLTPKEADVIRLYFGIGQERAQSLEEIGKRLNISNERARQLKEVAIRRLRHASRCNRLRGFMRD